MTCPSHDRRLEKSKYQKRLNHPVEGSLNPSSSQISCRAIPTAVAKLFPFGWRLNPEIVAPGCSSSSATLRSSPFETPYMTSTHLPLDSCRTAYSADPSFEKPKASGGGPLKLFSPCPSVEASRSAFACTCAIQSPAGDHAV